MTAPDLSPVLSVEQRISRLEGALGWKAYETNLKSEYFWVSFLVGIIALWTAISGLGAPNHLYQLAFAVLSISYLYHQGILASPKSWWHLSLFALNTGTSCVLFKLIIGSGKTQPFSWIQFPSFRQIAKEDGKWLPSMPGVKVIWEDSTISGLVVDLTMLQTFLLILIILGMVLSFHLLSSVLALLLLFLSIPAFLTFSWPWILPALVLFSISIYLQLSSVNQEPLGLMVEDPNEVEDAPEVKSEI